MSRGKYIAELDNVYAARNIDATARPIYYEYVSKYRRITVLGDNSGFEIEVSYKGVDVNDWSKRYRVKSHALSWAKSIATNRHIQTKSIGIIEPIGVQNI